MSSVSFCLLRSLSSTYLSLNPYVALPLALSVSLHVLYECHESRGKRAQKAAFDAFLLPLSVTPSGFAV